MKYFFSLSLLIGLLLWSASFSNGQVRNTVFDNGRIVTTFVDNVQKVETTDVSVAQTFDCPLITYKESGRRHVVDCQATLISSNAISLINFSQTIIPGSGQTRKYFIRWDGIQFTGDSRPSAVETEIEIGASTGVTPSLNLSLPAENTLSFDPERGRIEITPIGLKATDLYQILKGNQDEIKVSFRFDRDDPQPNIETGIDEIALKTPNVSTGATVPRTILLTLDRPLPYRPKKYTVALIIPWKLLRGNIAPDNSSGIVYEIPARKPDTEDKDDVLVTARKILLLPNEPERKKSEYAFEASYISQVKTDKTRRTDVGVFGVTVKPTIGLKSFGTGRGERNPGWVAFRPLMEADIDTLRPSESSGPNRILFGFDVELGRSMTNPDNFLRQFVWTNGIRYDNDRDFKLQTLYWRTELWLRFKKFEQSFEQRLYRFNLNKAPNETRKEPFVSSYYIRPRFGYELGGGLRRDTRFFERPTKNIYRPFVNLEAGIEIERLFIFTLKDTYYYLQNAESFKHRNYLETTGELKTGRLFSTDLAGFSNSIFLKFQRGNEPPTFKHVNAFSVGFKIFK